MINDYCIDEKNSWLDRHMEFIPRHKRIYTFDKFLLANKNRILVDDNIQHLEEWRSRGGIAICFIRGYNKDWKGLSIKEHYDIFELLEYLEREWI
jgi:5'(3')-deoxyribonucleotidase